MFNNSMLWILFLTMIFNLYQIKCECEDSSHLIDEYINVSNSYLHQKCKYKYDKIYNESIQIISNTVNKTQIYEVIIKMEKKCYYPQLVIDFDTTPLRDNPDAYYSFYIWENYFDTHELATINELYDYQLMIEHYTNEYNQCICLNSTKRILKTSPTLDKWAVVDSKYKQLIESQKLSDKTKNIHIKIIVGPGVLLSCNELNKFSLNAIFTVKCSSEFDWSFDFEDVQTISTFAGALAIFCGLWLVAIARVRCSELDEQYTKLNESRPKATFVDLILFGCGCNKRNRYYSFISYNDEDGHYPLANTWIWYVLLSMGLAVMPILLAIFGTEFSECNVFAVTIFLTAPFSIIHLLDFNCCTAHWFGKEFVTNKFGNVSHFIQNKSKQIAKCSYFIYFPIYVVMTIFHFTYLCSGTGLWWSLFSGGYFYPWIIPVGVVCVVTVGFVPFVCYWIAFVIMGSLISVHTGYYQAWSGIFAGMPTLLMFLFFSDHSRLNKLLAPFVGLAVSLYDAFTDINLILLWWDLPVSFPWAIFQIVFIFMGQLVGAIDEYTICKSKVGFLCTSIAGRIKYGFTISDQENDHEENEENKEKQIMQTLKINEMVWESINSVALQLYVATVFNQFNQTLLFSLATSFANVTDSLYHFIENGDTEKMVKKKWVTWISWIYIVTDFLYRIIPNIALVVLVDKYHGVHLKSGDSVFYLTAISLFVVNIFLELYVLGRKNPRHIILSLVSSSYLLLGALGITGVVKIEFKADDTDKSNYYFKIVKNERFLRVILSIIITVICLIWQVIIVTWEQIREENRIFYPEIFGLIICEFIVIIIHLQMAAMFDTEIIKNTNDNTDNIDKEEVIEQNTHQTNTCIHETHEDEVELAVNTSNGITSTDH